MSTADVLAGEAKHFVEHGDNRPWLASLPDKSVDVVITDPPYESEAHGLLRRKRGKAFRSGVRSIDNSPIAFPPITAAERAMVGAEIARVTRRWAIVFCQVEGAMLWRAALEPLIYKRTCVWTKPDGQPQLSGDRPGMGYESIVCAHVAGRSKWNGGGRLGVFTHIKADFASGRSGHQTQKPLPLMLELVSLFSEPGELVLDPYAGSGTTGVAALRLGRRFLGCELDATYATTARERLTAEDQGQSLASARAGQLSLLSGAA